MPNLLDHLFGGNVPAGLLTPSGIGQARKQGLLNAGIGMLAASQNNSFGGSLAKGLQAGQQGYGNSAATSVAMQEQQKAQEMEQRRQQIFAGLNPQPGETRDQTKARLQTALMALLRMGDNEGARSISEVLKTMGDGTAKEPGDWVNVTGPDGKPMRRYITASEAGATGIPVHQAPDPGLSEYQRERLENSRFSREQSLFSDFDSATKKPRNAVLVLNDTMRDKALAMQGDVAAQLRVLYGFINSMDDSVVREGEMRMVQAAAPLLAQAEAAASRLSTDRSQVVPRAVLAQMFGVMERRLAGNKQYLTQQEKYYRDVAARWQVDPSRFTVPLPGGDAPATEQTWDDAIGGPR